MTTPSDGAALPEAPVAAPVRPRRRRRVQVAAVPDDGCVRFPLSARARTEGSGSRECGRFVSRCISMGGVYMDGRSYSYLCCVRMRQRSHRYSSRGRPWSPHMQQTAAAAEPAPSSEPRDDAIGPRKRGEEYRARRTSIYYIYTRRSGSKSRRSVGRWSRPSEDISYIGELS